MLGQADSLVDEATSRRMAAVRRARTIPEQAVARIAKRLRARFEANVADLPGTPDLVFRDAGKVVFVHGCFWHRHGCPRCTTPRTRRRYWEDKFQRNQIRDRRDIRKLRKLGWGVMVVWECQVDDEASIERRLATFLRGQGHTDRP